MQLSFPIFTVLFLLAAASGMGIGGGGLLVVYLTVIHASDQASAQAFNLLFFIIAATTSAIIKYKKGSCEKGSDADTGKWYDLFMQNYRKDDTHGFV